MKKKMKTVKQLILELKEYPENNFVDVYSAESNGIVIYPVNYEEKQKDFEKISIDDGLRLEELFKLSSESLKTDFIEL